MRSNYSLDGVGLLSENQWRGAKCAMRRLSGEKESGKGFTPVLDQGKFVFIGGKYTNGRRVDQSGEKHGESKAHTTFKELLPPELEHQLK